MASSSTSSPQPLESPAATRNCDPIAQVWKQHISKQPRRVLEIGAGTGQHAVYLCQQTAVEKWVPCDAQPQYRASIDAYRRKYPELPIAAALPLTLDENGIVEQATKLQLEQQSLLFDVIVNINMMHISDWSATVGLMKVAGQWLQPNGILYVYGPFIVDDRPLALSNAQFDASLQERHSNWGLRKLSHVTALAAAHGLDCRHVLDMPANNLSVLFCKRTTE